MADAPDIDAIVTNTEDAEEQKRLMGEHWGAAFKVLTPNMRARGGSLGVNLMRVPARRAAVPFHWHAKEDEVFYVLSGRGVLRYGEETKEIRAGDCVCCPAGTKVAHQIGNPFDEDLVYLAMGTFDPNEICGYPDNGKVMVRTTQTVGVLEKRDYMDGEPDVPRVLSDWVESKD